MKHFFSIKIALSLLFCFSVTIDEIYSDTFFSEKFSGGVLPSGWSISNANSSNLIENWEFGKVPSDFTFFSTSSVGGIAYLYCNSFFNNSDTLEMELISPSIDCANRSSVVLSTYRYVSKPYYYSDLTECYFAVSVDNGNTWTRVADYDNIYGSEYEFIDLTQELAGQSQVRLKWGVYSINNISNIIFALDDVQLRESVHITSFQQLSDIDVLFKTTKDALPFSSTFIANTDNGECAIGAYPEWICVNGEYIDSVPGSYLFEADLTSLLPEGVVLHGTSAIVQQTVHVDSYYSELVSFEIPEPIILDYGYWYYSDIPVTYTTSDTTCTIFTAFDDWDFIEDDFDNRKAGDYHAQLDLVKLLPTNVLTSSIDSTNIVMDIRLEYYGNLEYIQVAPLTKVNRLVEEEYIPFPKLCIVVLEQEEILLDISEASWTTVGAAFDSDVLTTYTYTTDIAPLLENYISNTNNVSTTISTLVEVVDGCSMSVALEAPYYEGWYGGYIEVLLNGEQYSILSLLTYGHESVSLTIEEGDTLEVLMASGENQDKIEFSIYDSQNEVLYEGDPPSVDGSFLYFVNHCDLLDYDMALVESTAEVVSYQHDGRYSLLLKNNGKEPCSYLGVKVSMYDEDEVEVYTSTVTLSDTVINSGDFIDVAMDDIPSTLQVGKYRIVNEILISDDDLFNNKIETDFVVVDFEYTDDVLYYSDGDRVYRHSFDLDSYLYWIFASGVDCRVLQFIDGVLVGIDAAGTVHFIDDGRSYKYGVLQGITKGQEVEALAWDETNNIVYLLTSLDDYDNFLYKVDIKSLQTSYLGTITRDDGQSLIMLLSLTVGNDGFLYTTDMIWANSSYHHSLCKVDPLTLVSEKVVDLDKRLSYLQFDSEQDLFYCKYEENNDMIVASFSIESPTILPMFSNYTGGNVRTGSVLDVSSQSFQKVIFEVQGTESDSLVDGFTINLNALGLSLETDQEGRASALLTPGSYTYTVQEREDYLALTDTIEVVAEEVFVPINKMRKDQQTYITFSLVNALLNPIGGVSIVVDHAKYPNGYTDRETGILTLPLSKGKHHIYIEYPGYEAISEEIIVEEDKSLEYMFFPTAMLTFECYNSLFLPAVFVGFQHQTQVRVRIENSGLKDLDIVRLAFVGDDADMFTSNISTSGDAFSMRPNTYREYSVYYTPTKAGEHHAIIRIETADGEILERDVYGYAYDFFEAPYFQDFEQTDEIHYWTTQKIKFFEETQSEMLGGIERDNHTHWQSNRYHAVDSSYCASLYLVSNFTYDWLITPLINIGEQNADNVLDFDLGLLSFDNRSGYDDRFLVVVSTDSGHTWRHEDMLMEWDNDSSEYVFAELTQKMTPITCSLSKYAGNIMIGFYGETLIDNSSSEIMIDNVFVGNHSASSIERRVDRDFTLYPNPAETEIVMLLNEKSLVSIYSLSGQMMLQCHLDSGKQKLDISSFSTGIYMLHCSGNTMSNLLKLVVR